MLIGDQKVSSSREVASTPATQLGGEQLRVLHLNAGNLYGGVETFLTTLAEFRSLCPGMEPHFGACYEGRLTQELLAAGAPVHLLTPVRLSRPWTLWRARRRLRELLEKEHFDLIVCHMAWSLVVFSPAARAVGVKVAFWQHGIQNRTTWLDSLAHRMKPNVAIANSRYTAGSVRQHFPNTASQVIYYPGRLLEAPEAERWRAGVRQEQAVDEDTTVILQVSRMESWKGHLLHLHALARLKSPGKWVCWIAGGPQNAKEAQYFAHLAETAKELGIADRVRLLGQRSDVPKLLAAADIFCQPNQEPEPFGLVFVEALWAGRPVVTTAMGGALEIINASCGILTDPGNADSLSLALQRLIESRELRSQLGQAGPARARQLCDPATQLKELKELLQAAITGGGIK